MSCRTPAQSGRGCTAEPSWPACKRCGCSSGAALHGRACRCRRNQKRGEVACSFASTQREKMKMLSVLLVGLSVATDALRAGVSWSASTSPQVRHGAVCSLRAAVEGDSRSRIVLESDAAVGRYICERVEAIAMAAITETGGFSMSIGSGFPPALSRMRRLSSQSVQRALCRTPAPGTVRAQANTRLHTQARR